MAYQSSTQESVFQKYAGPLSYNSVLKLKSYYILEIIRWICNQYDRVSC